MRPFLYQRADSPDELQNLTGSPGAPPTYLAGGTTLLDLMKLGTISPERLLDINGLEKSYGDIMVSADTLRLGALARMSATADHPVIRRDFPVIAQSLELAASPQLRNMATLGGNVLQRTRCNYFRDPSWAACNKRNPGSGCAAIGGINRMHAVLGTSDHCIATYPGDFAQALLVLDAKVNTTGPTGSRSFGIEDLHLIPATTPQRETILEPGELITSFDIARTPISRRSVYLKIRDRESYEFALASAAVAIDIQSGIIHDIRIAFGGIATKPWRAHQAEQKLRGQKLTVDLAQNAADAELAAATSREANGYKVSLTQRTFVRAVFQAAEMEA